MARRRSLMPALDEYFVKPFSSERMPASRMCQGVWKSGSPMPSEMASGISARISKNLRMPDGWSEAARALRSVL